MRRRILIVEDEMTIALLLEDMLLELGHEVVNIVSRLRPAMAAAEAGGFELAVLDINLDGRPSFPVARVLAARGTPFLFATGYGAAGLDAEFADAPVLKKPFLQTELAEAIDRL